MKRRTCFRFFFPFFFFFAREFALNNYFSYLAYILLVYISLSLRMRALYARVERSFVQLLVSLLRQLFSSERAELSESPVVKDLPLFSLFFFSHGRHVGVGDQ